MGHYDNGYQEIPLAELGADSAEPQRQIVGGQLGVLAISEVLHQWLTELDADEQARFHPILTAAEERLLFQLWREAQATQGDHSAPTPSSVLSQNQAFVELIASRTPADREPWAWALATRPTIEEVILACNISFIRRVATMYRGPELPIEDRLNAGSDGFLEAARRFDVDRGTRLSSYAKSHTYWAIQLEACRRHNLTPAEFRAYNTMRYVAGGFSRVFGRDPTPDELERQLVANADGSEGRPRLTLSVIRRVIDMYRRSESTLQTADNVPNVRPDTDSETAVRLQRIRRAIEQLPDREQLLLLSKGGLIHQPFGEVAAGLGISQQAANYMLSQAVLALRSILEGLDALGEQNAGEAEVEKVLPDESQRMAFAAATTNRERVLILAQLDWLRPEITAVLDISKQRVDQLTAALVSSGELNAIPPAAPRRRYERRLQQLAEAFQTPGFKRGHAAAQLGVRIDTIDLMRRELRRRGVAVPQAPKEDPAVRSAAMGPETEAVREWMRLHPLRFKRGIFYLRHDNQSGDQNQQAG